jgi:hypothetical protein
VLGLLPPHHQAIFRFLTLSYDGGQLRRCALYFWSQFYHSPPQVVELPRPLLDQHERFAAGLGKLSEFTLKASMLRSCRSR